MEKFLFLVEKIAFLCRKVIFNVFGWSEWNLEDVNSACRIGNCLCLISSFINHSCDSNSYWDFHEGMMTLSTVW